MACFGHIAHIWERFLGGPIQSQACSSSGPEYNGWDPWFSHKHPTPGVLIVWAGAAWNEMGVCLRIGSSNIRLAHRQGQGGLTVGRIGVHQGGEGQLSPAHRGG